MVGHVADQINAFAAVGPFVVVPGHQFHELIVEGHAGASVKHRGAAFAQQVVRHDRVFGVSQNS